MKIFHISDLHIRSDMKHNYQVESKLYTLSQKLGPVDMVVLTGDITDDGSEVQYANALKLLTPFTNRIFVAPGNHDYGTMGLNYKRECVKRFNVLAELLNFPRKEFYDLRVLPIDSNLKTYTPFDFARGKVGWWNRRAIKKFGLQCKKDKKVSLVCLHHTPFEEHWTLELKDAEELLRACEGYVDLVLVGHEHKERIVSFSRQGTQQGTIYYSAPSLAHEGTLPTEIDIQFDKR
jgi:3',5'-cyclic AMP phosphodiesterase CpdA